jgi:hypothetical protein
MLELDALKAVLCDKNMKINLIGFLASTFIMFMCIDNLSHFYSVEQVGKPESMLYHAIGLIGLYISVKIATTFGFKLYKINEKRKRLK